MVVVPSLLVALALAGLVGWVCRARRRRAAVEVARDGTGAVVKGELDGEGVVLGESDGVVLMEQESVEVVLAELEAPVAELEGGESASCNGRSVDGVTLC